MATTTTVKLPGTPPAWMNAAMRIMLHAPGVQRLLGRVLAIMSVTGAKTGRRYTMPVQYLMHDGDVVVLSQRMRKWWRNIAVRPEVDLRLRGRKVTGEAKIAEGAEAQVILSNCFIAEPKVARFYGIDREPDGTIEPEAVEALLDRIVVIVVDIPSIAVELTDEDLAMAVR